MSIVYRGIGDNADDLMDWLNDRLSGASTYMLGRIQDYLTDDMYNTPDVAHDSTVSWFHASTVGLWAVLFTVSIIIAGVSMIWKRDVSEPGHDLLKSILTNILVSGAGAAVIVMVGKLADNFTVFLVNSNKLDVEQMRENIENLSGALGPAESFILFILIIGQVVAGFIILFSLVTRPALLILLASILPLAGAATNLGWGKQWFEKTISWVASFIVFKPAVAAILILGSILGATVPTDDYKKAALEELCQPGTELLKLMKENDRWRNTTATGIVHEWLLKTDDELIEECKAENFDPLGADMPDYEKKATEIVTNRMNSLSSGGFGTVLMGMAVLALAGLSLPAMIRFITPAVASSGSQGGAGISRVAGGLAATGAAVGGAVVGFGAAKIGGGLAGLSRRSGAGAGTGATGADRNAAWSGSRGGGGSSGGSGGGKHSLSRPSGAASSSGDSGGEESSASSGGSSVSRRSASSSSNTRPSGAHK